MSLEGVAFLAYSRPLKYGQSPHDVEVEVKAVFDALCELDQWARHQRPAPPAELRDLVQRALGALEAEVKP